ncbi:MAG: erythromycin esterase family protein [Ktedonobacterales bacterium]|nr:erythromycin esterase family protein [Ktedonobacterales bacterium]
MQAYIQHVDAPQAQTVAALYAPFLADTTNSTQQSVDATQTVVALLDGRQSSYVSHSSQSAFDVARQVATVIHQSAQYYRSIARAFANNSESDLNVAANYRDQAMANNVAWLHEHASTGAHIVLWAHDTHIGTFQNAGSTTPPYITMGEYLRQRYGAAYFAIGQTFYAGDFNTPGGNTHHLDAPTANSGNAVLCSLGMPLYFLDLHAIPASNARTWLDQPHPFLLVGAGYSAAHPPYATFAPDAIFDLIIHIQNVTASHPLCTKC